MHSNKHLLTDPTKVFHPYHNMSIISYNGGSQNKEVNVHRNITDPISEASQITPQQHFYTFNKPHELYDKYHNQIPLERTFATPWMRRPRRLLLTSMSRKKRDLLEILTSFSESKISRQKTKLLLNQYIQPQSNPDNEMNESYENFQPNASKLDNKRQTCYNDRNQTHSSSKRPSRSKRVVKSPAIVNQKRNPSHFQKCLEESNVSKGNDQKRVTKCSQSKQSRHNKRHVATKSKTNNNSNNAKQPWKGKKTTSKHNQIAETNNTRKTTVTLYTIPKPTPYLGAPAYSAANPSVLYQGCGCQGNTQMGLGNPSVMPSMSTVNRTFIDPSLHGMPMSPYGQVFPVPLPGQRDVRGHHSTIQQPLPVEETQIHSFKPLCQEYPPGYGCGRWHRLAMQEEAKRNGILALLNVMFCCCCNIEAEMKAYPMQHPHIRHEDD